MGGRRRSELDRRIVYSPLPSQKLFHQTTARFKGFSGPIGSGKSQALCQEALRLSYINAGRVGLLGAPTYRMLKDATLTSLLEVLRANRIPHEHNKSDNVVALKETGSRILCRTLSDSDALRGTNLAWFGADELTYAAEPSWLQLEGRLRDPKATHLCGYGVWTPKGRDWVHRRFIGNPAPGYRVILAKAFENRHLLAHVPDFYERLRKSYSERFFRQEALGEYLKASDGLVYSAFDRGLQVTPTALDAGFPLLWTLDFNVGPDVFTGGSDSQRARVCT